MITRLAMMLYIDQSHVDISVMCAGTENIFVHASDAVNFAESQILARSKNGEEHVSA